MSLILFFSKFAPTYGVHGCSWKLCHPKSTMMPRASVEHQTLQPRALKCTELHRRSTIHNKAWNQDPSDFKGFETLNGSQPEETFDQQPCFLNVFIVFNPSKCIKLEACQKHTQKHQKIPKTHKNNHQT